VQHTVMLHSVFDTALESLHLSNCVQWTKNEPSSCSTTVFEKHKQKTYNKTMGILSPQNV